MSRQLGLGGLLLLGAAWVTAATASTGTLRSQGQGRAADVQPSVVQVSVSSTDGAPDGGSSFPSISADGRFVVFRSDATNLLAEASSLAPNDPWPTALYRRDLELGRTALVSVSEIDGQAAGVGLVPPAISRDGRFVAFASSSPSIVFGDTNTAEHCYEDGPSECSVGPASDVFVRDIETGTTTRVSVSTAGVQGNDDSTTPSISADGRYVAFESWASNLVPGDTNGRPDVFVHDMLRGITTRVSVTSRRRQVNAGSLLRSISADGNLVVFESWSRKLDPGDRGIATDVFVHDRRRGRTTRVSMSSTGAPGNSDSFDPVISASGRFVAFVSKATNLVNGDTNRQWDIFVRDRRQGTTERVSVASNEQQADWQSFGPSISGDGRYIAFTSGADNLVAGGTNDGWNVFLRDRVQGRTIRLDVGPQGASQTQGLASRARKSAGVWFLGQNADISQDGRFVAFDSYATPLVTDPTAPAPEGGYSTPQVYVWGPGH